MSLSGLARGTHKRSTDNADDNSEREESRKDNFKEHHVDPSFLRVSGPSTFVFVLFMVMGGCCSNVWTYEELLKINATIGSALTFSQMLFITLQMSPNFVSWNPLQRRFLPTLKPRLVPLTRWIVQVFLLTGGSLLTNWAFAFDVPLTVQIVFRSAGLVVSMILGYIFFNKRYSARQMVCACMVTIGATLASLSRSQPVFHKTHTDPSRYSLGIVMLVSSLIITGLLGIMQEKTYKDYGPCWRECIFYTHLMSLPLFIFFIPDVKQGVLSLSGSQQGQFRAFLIMSTNLISQLICISGVNKLSSQVSSVSTNLVLTIRKIISLCLSMWWFDNGWNTQLIAGAFMVFSGSFVFAL